MKTMKQIILFLFLFAFVSCEKNNEPIVDNPDLLIGSWINPDTEGDYTRYERTNSLQDNLYGFSFQSDNSFVERKNIGWCGTPPITYGDYTGSWTKNDAIVDITVPFWGGIEHYQWKIISVDEKYLTIAPGRR
jgi:hypothetical protein